MIPLVTELAKAFMSETKDAVLIVNQQSIQSDGGILVTAGSDLAIGMANRPLKEEENQFGLYVFEIAIAAVGGVNRSVVLDGLSSDDYCRDLAWHDHHLGAASRGAVAAS